MQKTALALSALIVSLTLTGCSSSATLACDPSGGGAQVDSIEVSSEPLTKPTVSFASPITADAIQSRIVIEGDGAVFTGKNLIEFEFALKLDFGLRLRTSSGYPGVNEGVCQ